MFLIFVLPFLVSIGLIGAKIFFDIEMPWWKVLLAPLFVTVVGTIIVLAPWFLLGVCLTIIG